MKLADGNGVEFVSEVKARRPLTEVLLLTAYGNIADGVQSIKNGAFDYITKGDIILSKVNVRIIAATIRELKNVIERSIILSDKDVLEVESLPANFRNASQDSDNPLSGFSLANVEKIHIDKVLKHTNGNKTETARLLNIGLTTLYRKISEYEL